jgi:hypothetical protein
VASINLSHEQKPGARWRSRDRACCFIFDNGLRRCVLTHKRVHSQLSSQLAMPPKPEAPRQSAAQSLRAGVVMALFTLNEMTPPVVRTDGAGIFCRQQSKGQGDVQYLLSLCQEINSN